MAANYSSNVSKAFGDITGVSQWQHAKWSSRDVAIFDQNFFQSIGHQCRH